MTDNLIVTLFLLNNERHTEETEGEGEGNKNTQQTMKHGIHNNSKKNIYERVHTQDISHKQREISQLRFSSII